MITTIDAKLPFTKIESKEMNCEFERQIYTGFANKGIFSKPQQNIAFRVSRSCNVIVLNLAGKNDTK